MTLREDIEQWVNEFVSVFNPKLNAVPCPFAKAAIVKDSVEYVEAESDVDIVNICYELGKSEWQKPIVIIGIDPERIIPANLTRITQLVNAEYLGPSGYIALPDHPYDKEVIAGVEMNQGKWALLIIQEQAELNNGRDILMKTSYYDTWTEEQVKEMHDYK